MDWIGVGLIAQELGSNEVDVPRRRLHLKSFDGALTEGIQGMVQGALQLQRFCVGGQKAEDVSISLRMRDGVDEHGHGEVGESVCQSLRLRTRTQKIGGDRHGAVGHVAVQGATEVETRA